LEASQRKYVDEKKAGEWFRIVQKQNTVSSYPLGLGSEDIEDRQEKTH
jgi:hypothetical protein